MTDFFFKEVLSEYLVDIPLHLICLIGIILALVFYGRHPAVSLLTLCALTLVIHPWPDRTLDHASGGRKSQGWLEGRIDPKFA